MNKAYSYLSEEVKKVNKKIEYLENGQSSISDLDKTILKNSLYGVDLNNESIEITKLSLWIQTANKYSTLTSLDENIKSGNSIVSSNIIAGDKAFNWNTEFEKVYKKSI